MPPVCADSSPQAVNSAHAKEHHERAAAEAKQGFAFASGLHFLGITHLFFLFESGLFEFRHRKRLANGRETNAGRDRFLADILMSFADTHALSRCRFIDKSRNLPNEPQLSRSPSPGYPSLFTLLLIRRELRRP